MVVVLPSNVDIDQCLLQVQPTENNKKKIKSSLKLKVTYI